MNCEETRSLLAAWLDGELAQNTGRNVEAHVAACHECGAIAASYRNIVQTFQAADEAAQSEESVAEQTNATLWRDIQSQIQAEANAALRQEMEQMRQMLTTLQREVGELRRQVNHPAQSPRQREASRFDILMPGTPSLNPSTNLRSLL